MSQTADLALRHVIEMNDDWSHEPRVAMGIDRAVATMTAEDRRSVALAPPWRWGGVLACQGTGRRRAAVSMDRR